MLLARPGGNTQSLYSNGAKDLVKAAQDLDWCHATSTPYCSNTNGRVERDIRSGEEGARTVLCEAGLPHKWWPYAARSFGFAQNILGLDSDKLQPFELRFGSPSRGAEDTIRSCYSLPAEHVSRQEAA